MHSVRDGKTMDLIDFYLLTMLAETYWHSSD